MIKTRRNIQRETLQQRQNLNLRARWKPSLLKQQLKIYCNIWRTPLQHVRELNLESSPEP
jgi:hypothetical protein